MTVTIIRRTGWIGMGGGVLIKIDGKKIKKIKSEQKTEITLSNDRAELQVSQFVNRSNKLEINDGDIVEITTSKWSSSIFFLIIIFLASINFIPSFQYRKIVLLIYTIVLIIVVFSKKWIHLKKIY